MQFLLGLAFSSRYGQVDVSSPTPVYKAYYYHFDGLGSIIAVTDSTGNAVEAYRYSVYGLADKPTTAGNPYLFTGRQFDVETGLYYYRARYYSAAIDYLWRHSGVTFVCVPTMVAVCSQYVTSVESLLTPKKRI